MKKYLKHFLWLFIVIGVLAVVFIVINVVKKTPETESYTRTNTECLTEERVFDYADKLTDEEEENLRTLIGEKEDQIGCDIVLVTLDDSTNYNMMGYADDFYDENKFGYNGPWGDGAVYVDNWGTGDTWLSTSGRVETKYSEGMIDRLVDDVCDVVNSNPYLAYCTYVEELAQDMTKAGSLGVSIPMGTPFIFALLVSGVYLIINLMNNKGAKTTTANTYVAGGVPNIKVQQDIFVNKHVTRRHIERSSGGGGGGHHMSSGGHSHGGGGGHH